MSVIISNHAVLLLILIMILVTATWADIMHHRIPNVLSLGGMVIALCLQTWMFGIDGLLVGLSGLSVGLMIFLPFYALSGMGAGDVKLMAAVGSFLSPFNALLAVAFTLIAGGLLGVLVLLYRRGFMTYLRRYGSTLKCLIITGQFSYIPPDPGEAAATRFPYALAIATGTIAALWWLSYLSPLTAMLKGS